MLKRALKRAVIGCPIVRGRSELGGKPSRRPTAEGRLTHRDHQPLEDHRGVEDIIRSGDLGLDSKLILVWDGIIEVRRLVDLAEPRVSGYKETRKNEKKALESNLVSLMDERGLQRAGFELIIGSGGTMEHQVVESSGASSTGNKLDADSNDDDEVIILASTVERLRKNLRLEISQLRGSLDEARSNNEHLQSLMAKQSQKIVENALHIKDLEEWEKLLAQNIEDLLIDFKDMEIDVSRWRESCELEVEDGKNEVSERDKVVTILQQELES